MPFLFQEKEVLFMGTTHWFFGCATEQQIKKRFHELMLIHHPDRGGNLQICLEIVGQYHESLKNCQYTGCEYNGEKQAYRYNEAMEKEFEEAMDWAMTLSFCKVELIGTWLWVSGKTFPISNKFRERGFHWASKKHAWCFHVGLWRRNKRHFALDDLRAKYGYEVLKEEEDQKAMTC
jgi:hypothetical protein